MRTTTRTTTPTPTAENAATNGAPLPPPAWRAAATCALLLAGLPGTAPAQTAYETRVQMSIGDLLFEDARSGALDTTPQALGHQLTAANGDHSQASTVAGLGVNKAVATLHIAEAAQPVQLAYALATNTYWDTLTISDPALDGSLGSFSTTLLVNGSGSFAISPSWSNNLAVDISAQWRSGITVGNAELGFQENVWAGAWNRDRGNGSIRYVGDALNNFQQNASFSFVYGQPFALGVSLQTAISLFNTSRLAGALDATLDLGHSVYWGGMALHDGDGNPVAGAMLQSASGVDWRLPVGVAAVPEPGAAALLLAGLAAGLVAPVGLRGRPRGRG